MPVTWGIADPRCAQARSNQSSSNSNSSSEAYTSLYYCFADSPKAKSRSFDSRAKFSAIEDEFEDDFSVYRAASQLGRLDKAPDLA